MMFDVFFQGPLKRWLHVNFGEAFTAWIHVKVRPNVSGSLALSTYTAESRRLFPATPVSSPKEC